MKIITERTQVREVAERWRQQYGSGSYAADRRGRMVGDELSALDPEVATAEDVAAIIGHNGWCGPSTCNECGEKVAVAVQVGEEPDYESRTATLCLACVEKALALMGSNVMCTPSGASTEL